MKILSLFDGMSCGMLAMLSAGVPVDRYVAYEIDKYAVKTSQHNFPMIEQMGDVFKADFTQYKDFTFLVGGSPCTYWSIAQKNNRETEASGLGWDLFSQYVRALNEAKPRYFIYENNKSMSRAIRDSIREAFGFEEICINSALVSAQNRQRYYWVGKRNTDGTYSKVDVSQPEDRGIFLKDILDGMYPVATQVDEKAHCLTSSYQFGCSYQDSYAKGRRSLVAEPVNVTGDGKSHTVKSQYYKNGTANFVTNGGYDASAVAEPVGIPETLTGKSRPLCAHYAQLEHQKWYDRVFNPNPNKQQHDYVAEPTRVGTYPNTAKNQEHDSKQYRIYDTDGKSTTLCGEGGGMGAKTGLYAVPAIVPYATPVEWNDHGSPVRAVSGSDGKTYDAYEVCNGMIFINDALYPIKLANGYWIIRKLTVRECKRLQTVPEWYDFSCVSNTQAYRMLGNGWTVEVIVHLINACTSDWCKTLLEV